MRSAYFLDRLINFFIGVAVIILGFRILFRLFDANATAPFVEWIYRTSDVFMAPFRNIFPPAEVLEPGITLDVSAIFTAIMYIVIGALLVWILDLAAPRPIAKKRK